MPEEKTPVKGASSLADTPPPVPPDPDEVTKAELVRQANEIDGVRNADKLTKEQLVDVIATGRPVLGDVAVDARQRVLDRLVDVNANTAQEA